VCRNNACIACSSELNCLICIFSKSLVKESNKLIFCPKPFLCSKRGRVLGSVCRNNPCIAVSSELNCLICIFSKSLVKESNKLIGL
jgi:hypothetical protein